MLHKQPYTQPQLCSKQHCFTFYLTMQHTLNPSKNCSRWLIFYHLPPA
uniref:Uncharacterized protein n=1 Tax=Rhizophora mucronata TaxID=61149 RepID=A0A2P2JJF3_RHIMU